MFTALIAGDVIAVAFIFNPGGAGDDKHTGNSRYTLNHNVWINIQILIRLNT